MAHKTSPPVWNFWWSFLAACRRVLLTHGGMTSSHLSMLADDASVYIFQAIRKALKNLVYKEIKSSCRAAFLKTACLIRHTMISFQCMLWPYYMHNTQITIRQKDLSNEIRNKLKNIFEHFQHSATSFLSQNVISGYFFNILSASPLHGS